MTDLEPRDARRARFIGIATSAAGGGLVAAPRLSLHAMGSDDADPAPLLLRVVGMFMAVSGGMLADGTDSALVLRWSVVEKVGAAAAVTYGVASGQYHPRALGVAAFDGVSAVLLARMLRRSRR
jgi:hypothetical protein